MFVYKQKKMDTYFMPIDKRSNITEVVKTYSKKLFGFVRGRVKTDEDAEDIVQEVWYQFSNLTQVDEIEKVSSWLYRVARNKITDRYRKKNTLSLEEMDFDDEENEFSLLDYYYSDENTPETDFLRELFWETLMQALDELPKNQRDVFVWNEFEDRTLQEIANETGEKLKTIISRKGYAVKFLRKKLEALYLDLLNY